MKHPQINKEFEAFSSFGKSNKQSYGFSNNCVIYTRVSTKEQADNNMSLSTQKKSCEQYAEKHGYVIVGHFGGTYESAKTDERKEFNKMLTFVKKTKEKIRYIIVYSVDRFSRSGANAIYITDQLKKQGVIVMSVTQPTDSTTASGSLQQNIQYIFSEYDNQLRREKCMSGVKEALLRGEWCNTPPMGYDSIRRDGKRMIVLNDTGKLLKKAFQWKANNVSTQEICERFKALGLKLHHQQISKLLRNPFYCGLITHSMLEGAIVRGKQEVLISEKLFLKVNDILSENVQGYAVNHENENIPLKNFVKCGSCGNSMPGYIVKKKQLWYYKCRTVGCCNNKSASSLHKAFVKLLEPMQLSISNKATDLIRKKILFTISSEIQEQDKDHSLYLTQLSELETKLKRLEERYILEEITKDQYVRFTEKFTTERKEISMRLEKSDINMSNLEKSVNKLVTFSSKLAFLWISSDYEGKNNIQNLIFPEGISYFKKNDECRTPKINPLFSYILVLKRVLEEKKQGINEVNFNYAPLVELQGVELIQR